MKRVYLWLMIQALGLVMCGQVPNYIGLRVGYSSFEMSSNGPYISQNTEPHNNVFVSITYQHALDNVFTLQPEIQFVNKGFSYSVRSGERLKYFSGFTDVVLFGKATYPLSDKFELSAMAGPFLGYAFTGQIKFNDQDFSNTRFFDQLNRLDYGAKAGGSIAWVLPRGRKVELDARYTLGLNNMLKPNTELNPLTDQGKYRGFDISLGLNMAL